MIPLIVVVASIGCVIEQIAPCLPYTNHIWFDNLETAFIRYPCFPSPLRHIRVPGIIERPFRPIRIAATNGYILRNSYRPLTLQFYQEYWCSGHLVRGGQISLSGHRGSGVISITFSLPHKPLLVKIYSLVPGKEPTA